MKRKSSGNGRRKKSITRQFTFIIAGLVAGTVLLCWLLNVTLLEGYYKRNKQELMMSAFERIDYASERGALTEREFDVEFENICANGNITILIITPGGGLVRCSASGVENLQIQFSSLIMEGIQNEKLDMDLVEANGRYVMGESEDTRLESDYLILWGTLADGNLILARTPLESIKESAEISNQLLFWVGITAVIISCIIIFFVSRRITKPLLKLTDISKQMAELDFDVKYEGSGHNEIDELGKHMNQLSGALERTISELKSANIALQKDIEKREQIDEMRKEFLSNVSHELKTPLALIQGYAEGLQECVQEDEESFNFYCDVIVDEAEKMNCMVKKLLTLNQLEFGNNDVVMERFDVTELIGGILSSSAILLEQNGITAEFDEPPVYVWGDEFLIEEVVNNYLSNAIHYASGEKRIRISYERREGRVRITVFNTGDPIPVDEQERIWVKFYKVDKARTREYGGSGIGLSIVKAVMDSLYQECGVENRQDGVAFWLELDADSNSSSVR